MVGFTWLEFEQQEGIATIRLNRPESLNALTDDLLREISGALAQAERDPFVRVVVITGAGRGFCSGQDLKALPRDPDARDIGAHLDRFYHPLIEKMHEMPKPIIAMVQGVAAGAGMSLAMAADLRIASQTARFSQAFVRIALVPDSGASYFLPRLVGIARALELAWFGDMIDAETALNWGLVNRVVAPDELTDATYAWAKRLAAAPPLSLAMIKREMYRGAESRLHDALQYEKGLQVAAAGTEDHRIGVEAFLNKTTPTFRGR